MKILLLLCFLSAAMLLRGQNWAPVQAGYVYYGSDTSYSLFGIVQLGLDHAPIGYLAASLYQNTLYAFAPKGIQSLEIDGQVDSNGHLDFKVRPFLARCDTCYTPTLHYKEKPFDGLYPSMAQLANGQYQLIIYTDTFLLAADPSQTSPSTPTQAYQLNVVQFLIDTVITYRDSVTLDSAMYIEVYPPAPSNQLLYRLAISKNYGLYRVQYYSPTTSLLTNSWSLLGRQHATNFEAVGWHSLKYREIFDYQVGDQFYYLFEDGNRGGWPSAEVRYRIKVLARDDSSPDTLRYLVQRHLYAMYDYYYLRGPFSRQTDTITLIYTNDREERYNIYPHELHASSRPYVLNQHSGQPIIPYLACNDYVLNSTESLKYVGYNMDFPVRSNIVSNPNYYPYYSVFIHTAPNTYQIDTLVWYTFRGHSPHRESYAYTPGLGCSSYFVSVSYSQTEQRLIGYIKGTDTVGSTPSIIFLNQPKILVPTSVTVQILPNPVQDYLHLTYQSPTLQGKLQLYIVNALGQVLDTGQVNAQAKGNYSCSVTDLPAGHYWLQIRHQEALLATQAFTKT